ncbi:DUF2563 family protein [Streptantibioticus ferralitis]|uniref:DUF2563 family protein n=1 Tax=Streptantibioticus ferralitis TaxID=236510 RepID=A0ABT5ZAP3_9ACTN|nr:DUF2563 family protein [Streptantibioticus ferralitis]MDF2260748.1 DUF2563 family protein [Streptantibioticus ferralitis]
MAGSNNGSPNVGRAPDALLTIQKRINDLLTKLEQSAASHTKLGGQTVSRGSYGGKFAEADDLHALYDNVHSQLVTLSQTFSDQLEALGIAVQISDRGYDSIDQEQADRLREIQKRTAQYYQAPKPSGTAAQPADGHGKSVTG